MRVLILILMSSIFSLIHGLDGSKTEGHPTKWSLKAVSASETVSRILYQIKYTAQDCNSGASGENKKSGS
jgi:hypothetical protein